MLRKGFTLIELLLVVIIIGIIASIALPRFSNVREQAYRSVITSDIRTLMTQQELSLVQTNGYISKGTYDTAPAGDFRASAGVSWASITGGTPAGRYVAGARHGSLTAVGNATNAKCVSVGGTATETAALVTASALFAAPVLTQDGQIQDCGAL